MTFDFGIAQARSCDGEVPYDGASAAYYNVTFACGCTAIAGGVNDGAAFVKCAVHCQSALFDFGIVAADITPPGAFQHFVVTLSNGDVYYAGGYDDQAAFVRHQEPPPSLELRPTDAVAPGPAVRRCTRCQGTTGEAGTCACEVAECERCGEVMQDCVCVECERCDARGLRNDIGYCRDCERCGECCDATYCEHCERREHDLSMCSRCDRCDSCCECARCEHCGDLCEATCGDCDRGECCGCSCLNEDDDAEYNNPSRVTFHRATKTERKENPSARFVAAEIEVVSARKHEMYEALEKWRCAVVGDGSLPAGGFEINTSPAGGDKFVEQIDDICGALKADNAKVDQSCGLHVHIDARDFTYHDIRRLVLLYEQIEPALFATQPQSRQRNRYCQPCGKKYAQDMRDALRPKETKAAFFETVYGRDDGGKMALKRKKGKKGFAGDKYNHNRYHALNLHSWIYRGTIECRMHSGTVSSDKIVAWGMLWAGLLDYAMRTPEREIRALNIAASIEAQQKFLLRTATGDNVRKYLKERWNRFSAYPVE